VDDSVEPLGGGHVGADIRDLDALLLPRRAATGGSVADLVRGANTGVTA